MQQGKFEMFRNRLEKVYRHLSRQARRLGVDCWRVYDHDLPEFPFILEIYHNKLFVSEYKRRHDMDETGHSRWLEASRQIMSSVLNIEEKNIFTRLRQRKTGRQGQYQKLEEEKNEFIVKENGLSFLINLTDYLDTGLFLDHRITRQMVRDKAGGKAVLNLFAYTGSFSVYAAAGQASEVVTVDLSRTYLDWAERNMKLNFENFTGHKIVHADVKQFLKQCNEKFDLVIMDPPTFSNSKRMDDILDVQRDHAELINDCLKLLNKDGEVVFSTNFTKFRLEEERINASSVRDITKATTPFDFEGKLRRPCYLVRG